MAAFVATLWSTTASVNGWGRGLLIASWIATGLLVVLGVVLLFLPSPEDDPERRGTTGLLIDETSEDIWVDNAYFEGFDTGIDNRGKGSRLTRVGATAPPRLPEPDKPQRKVWSFPEMPWKRKKKQKNPDDD